MPRPQDFVHEAQDAFQISGSAGKTEMIKATRIADPIWLGHTTRRVTTIACFRMKYSGSPLAIIGLPQLKMVLQNLKNQLFEAIPFMPGIRTPTFATLPLRRSE